MFRNRYRLVIAVGLVVAAINIATTIVGFLHWQSSFSSPATPMTQSADGGGNQPLPGPFAHVDNDVRTATSSRRTDVVDRPAPNVTGKPGELAPCAGQSSIGDVIAKLFPFGKAEIDDIYKRNIEVPKLSGCNKQDDVEFDKFRAVADGLHYVYSAYYDDRRQVITSRTPNSSRDHSVRVMALMRSGSNTGGRARRPKPFLYCHTWADDDPLRGRHWAGAFDYYEMCENHGKQYGGWILTCRLPPTDGRSPCRVGISTDTSAFSADMVMLPVYRTSRNAAFVDSRRPAVCVSPLFGRVARKTLIEFIEMSLLVGHSHVVLYRPADMSSVDDVIRYYRAAGLVSAVNWTLPGSLTAQTTDGGTPGSPLGAVWYHGQLLAVNDCLYRTMHAYKRVAFNDIDEFIVPRQRHIDLAALLDEVDESASHPGGYCAYSFRSAFFDPMTSLQDDFAGTGSALSASAGYELESDIRTMSLSSVRSKVIVDPQLLFEVGIHHVSRILVEGQCVVYNINPSDAIIHHYRQCVADFDVRLDCSRQCLDDTLSRSWRIPILRRRVHRTLQALSKMKEL